MHLPIDYIPKKVSILGAGRSGCAAAQFLGSKGDAVFISDACSPEKLAEMLAANQCGGFPSEAGGHTERVLDADVIILSPGVPSDLPVLQKAKSRGVAVWSEIELAFRFSKGAYLAITGSTGKSTTISMLGSILKAAGVEHSVAGNIGVPLVSTATKIGPTGFIAAEISSFQLENIDCFRPKVAVVLNLLKNHLDRYKNEEDYYNAKKAIAVNMGKNDHVVINHGDPLLARWAGQLDGRTNVVRFGNGSIPSDGVWYENGALFSRFGGAQEHLLDVKSMRLRGRHNYENACAAAAAAHLAGIGHKHIASGLSEFSGLEHRLEYVAEIDGVRYYNDSKSTTAESILCAISAFEHNVHLIAGGRDKGCDFSIVKEAIAKNVKSVCLIGEAAGRMEKVWSGCAPISNAATLEEAVKGVHAKADPGDVTLFSPGCSSFDMFRDFEHRGEVFKKSVLQLQEKR
jgi:UDP-N-acetylmuramoylalanine--D-glutamate ligase